MKKVVFVIGVLSDGGAERVISVLSKQLTKIGYKVDIVTIYGDKNDYLDDQSINIKPVVHKSKNKLFRTLGIISEVRNFIKSSKPDLVISFVAIVNIYTILSCLFLKTKLIISERNDPYQNPENKYIRTLRDVLYKLCDGFVFQTPDARDYFPKRIQDKSTVIPNPIVSDLPEWDIEKSEEVIISACRLAKQKNLPMMIDAFAKLKQEFPEYKLKIYGIGPLRGQLLSYINKLGLKDDILLPGFSKDIHQEMAKSNLFVISSNYEGISNSMLEALAIGMPVISTDSPIGGARMFIKSEENGMLIPVGDTEKLYQAMKMVISDRNFAISLSKEARGIRKKLLPEVVVSSWNEYITSVCEESHGRLK
ncbi:glycosyltransferase [Ectobacillus ponti]|uniref:Glycosyltransferase n=1 Tax=Ectobacillus ponti TaxID=2961894 RepID=A0AA41X345_9BACI|nr:glycosyltransferase [Ectobacillus ponti]MCP8967837.1 glycosyltransferase [Ectobacillus ponti]